MGSTVGCSVGVVVGFVLGSAGGGCVATAGAEVGAGVGGTSISGMMPWHSRQTAPGLGVDAAVQTRKMNAVYAFEHQGVTLQL